MSLFLLFENTLSILPFLKKYLSLIYLLCFCLSFKYASGTASIRRPCLSIIILFGFCWFVLKWMGRHLCFGGSEKKSFLTSIMCALLGQEDQFDSYELMWSNHPNLISKSKVLLSRSPSRAPHSTKNPPRFPCDKVLWIIWLSSSPFNYQINQLLASLNKCGVCLVSVPWINLPPYQADPIDQVNAVYS